MAEVRCQGCGTVYHLEPSSAEARKCDICGKQLEMPLAPPAGGPARKSTPPATPERPSNFYRKPEAPLPSPGAPAPQATPQPKSAATPQAKPVPMAKPMAPPSPSTPPPMQHADPQAPVPTAMPVAPPATTPPPPTPPAASDVYDSGIDEVETSEEPPAETQEPTRSTRPAPRPSRKSNTWMTCLLLVVLGVVVFGAVGGIVVALRFKQIMAMASGEGLAPAMSGPIIAVPAGAVQSNWADATESAVRRGDVQVSVIRVEYGEVRGKDKNNAVTISDEKDYMQIYLSITNKGEQPLDYVSWYGNTFGPAAASLTNLTGNTYQMYKFTGLRSIRGHTQSATLKPREEITDVLIFSVPRGATGSLTAAYRLSLPAAAYGEEGEFRFEFPGSYVTVIPESTDFGGPLTADAMAADAMMEDP